MAEVLKLVILDRDGVINYERGDYIKTVEEWKPLPGSPGAIAGLSRAGIKVAVATNQSGVGRGLYSLAALEDIHSKLRLEVAKAGGRIDMISYCPHSPSEGCECRKPKPGMLRRILSALDVRPGQALFVGDHLKDVEAARSLRVTPVLVRTGKGLEFEKKIPEGVKVFDDLAALVSELISPGQGPGSPN